MPYCRQGLGYNSELVLWKGKKRAMRKGCMLAEGEMSVVALEVLLLVVTG